jgi:hypothetical protein
MSETTSTRGRTTLEVFPPPEFQHNSAEPVRQALEEALAQTIVEAFDLYIQIKQLYWRLALANQLAAPTWINTQAEQIFADLARLVQRDHCLREPSREGSQICCPGAWPLLPDQVESNASGKGLQLAHAHIRLAEQIGKALAVCAWSSDSESEKILWGLLRTVEASSRAFASHRVS